jgi:hypothetical protein
MAMEVHNTPKHDMDCFIRECVRLFHDRQSGGFLSLFFCIQFLRHHVNIVLQCALVSAIEKKIALAGDVCSRPPTITISHDLHANDIRGAMGEIASYHKKEKRVLQVVHLLAFLWASLFVSIRMVIAINLLLDFSSSFLLCGKGVLTTTICKCNKCMRYV